MFLLLDQRKKERRTPSLSLSNVVACQRLGGLRCTFGQPEFNRNGMFNRAGENLAATGPQPGEKKTQNKTGPAPGGRRCRMFDGAAPARHGAPRVPVAPLLGLDPDTLSEHVQSCRQLLSVNT